MVSIQYWIFALMVACLAFLGIMVIVLIVNPRFHRHYHYHNYKASKDYDRFYDLVINKGAKVCVIERDENNKIYRYNTAGPSPWNKYEGHSPEYSLGTCDRYMKVKDKDAFIGYCKWRDIEFLDMVEED